MCLVSARSFPGLIACFFLALNDRHLVVLICQWLDSLLPEEHLICLHALAIVNTANHGRFDTDLRFNPTEHVVMCSMGLNQDMT